MNKHKVTFWAQKHYAVGSKKNKSVSAYEVSLTVVIYVWAEDADQALALAQELDYIKELTDIARIEAERVYGFCPRGE